MNTIKNFFYALNKKDRLTICFVFLIIIVASFFEMFSLALLLPFLSILIGVEPDSGQALDFFLFIKEIAVGFNVNLITFIAICLISFVFLSLITRVFLNIFLSKTIFNIGYRVSNKIFEAFLKKPFWMHSESSSDEISSSIIKVDNFLQVMNASLQGVSALLISLFILASVFYLDFYVALYLSIYFITLYLLVMFFTQKKLNSNGRLLNSSLEKRTKSIIESSRGIKEIILSASADFFLERFNSQERNYRDAQTSNHIISPLPRLVIESIAIISIVSLSFLFYSTDSNLAGIIPSLTIAIVAFQRVLPMFQQAYHGWVLLSGHMDLISSITDEFTQSNKIIDKVNEDIKNRGDEVSFEDKIELKDLSFAYKKETIFENINLQINKGEKIGLIGESGVGKTTLINLIMGLIEPKSGHIRVDGIEVSKKKVPSWWQQISHLPQKVFLFNDNLENNIAIGKNEAIIDKVRVLESLRKASLEIFLDKGSYKNDYLGEDGSFVSGGQKQRIALSRAFYKKANLLILDEPSSALDKQTELKVFESIFNNNPELTIIFISHSSEFLNFCDRIYEIKDRKLNLK